MPRSQRRTIFLILAIILILLVGGGLWMGSSAAAPAAVPSLGDLASSNRAESIDSTSISAERPSNDASLTETDRQPIPIALEATGSSSLLLRFVDRATGEPVAKIVARLIPKDAVSFRHKEVQGVSDQQGEILWENISWDQVRVYPPYTEETFALEPGLLNERIQEVDLMFTIVGTVVDTHGQPVADAEIWAGSSRDRAVEVTMSDATGSFAFPVYATDHSFVYAWSAGKGPSRVALVSQSEGSRITELRLHLGDQCGSIIGKVVTPDGEPIPGASIRSRASKAFLPPQEDPGKVVGGTTDNAPLSPAVHTDASGEFRFDDVPIGEAMIKVSADGWAGTVTKVKVVHGGTSQIQVTMSRGARIVGSLRDSEGSPVEGVTMTARNHTFATRYSITDAKGDYVLENVEPGFLSLQASHPQRGVVNETKEIVDGQELRWEPVFGAGVGIRGLVVDSEGAPMVERSILVTGEDGNRRMLKTDSEGRFAALYSKQQGHEIAAYPEGFGSPITIAKDVRPSAKEMTFRLPPLPSIDASVTGIILGAAGRPALSAKIIGRESKYSGFAYHKLSSADGRFTLGPMLSGEWSIKIETADHPRLTRNFVLGPGETKDLGELTLGEAVPVEVMVRGTESIEGRIVGLLWGSGYENERIIVASGHVQLPPLAPGSYRLEIFGEKLVRAAVDMEVVRGRDARFEIIAQPGVSRSFELVLPDGTEDSLVRFRTYDENRRELMMWNKRWYSHWGVKPITFRPEAVRIVVTSEEGLRAEASLGSGGIRLVLR